MKRFPLATLAVAFVFLAGCAATLAGVQACVVSIATRGGERSVQYRRAVIVGEVDGADEWWVELPDDDRALDSAGRPRALNFPKSAVLRVGEVRMIGTFACRCPQGVQTSALRTKQEGEP